jgi:hypothetical protein
MVDPEKQRFKCWGCGAHGDVIDFLAMIKGLDTKEAIRRAANLAGIFLDRPLSREERSRLEGEARERRIKRRCQILAHKASLLAEQDLPRPSREEELPAYDILYALKDKLDQGVLWVENLSTLRLYLRGLAAWRKWALVVLDKKGEHLNELYNFPYCHRGGLN